MSLEQFQHALQERILQKNPPGEGDPLGLAIYHNAYRCRLVDTLADTFERVFKLLGENSFNALAIEFIESHSSEHYSLAEYGSGFPLWLLERDSSITAEVAKIDWAMHRCFTGKNAEPLNHIDLGKLSEQDWEVVSFKPVPTAHLMETTGQAIQCWRTLEQSQSAAPVENRQEKQKTILVWRKGLSPMMRTLKPHEIPATRALLNRQSFMAICELLAQTQGEQTQEMAGTLLAQWLTDELLSGYQTNTN